MRAGRELRQARERAGLSAEQIAERTKIQVHRIEALENDNFENLPAGIYLDGIVRAYAHEVAIDPEPLIERVRYERAEATRSSQADPADLDAFASERDVKNDAPDRTISTPSRVVDDNEPALMLASETEPRLLIPSIEATRPERGPGRFVLPLLLLLAAAGLGEYFYLAHGGYDFDSTRETSASRPESTAPDASTTSSAAGPTPQQTAGTAVRETEVATGTSGPKERTRPLAAPSTATAPAAPAPSSARTAASAASAKDAKDVSGSWTLATHVESSSYQRFEDLRLGYDLQLEQAGNRVTGTGRKVTENGDGISSRVQTPISVAGTINGDRLTLTFNERGARRPTEGKFVLLLDESGTMRGRFSSSAAQSSGTVEAHRTTP
jgi:cytoskeletal protein RodZ